MNAHSNTHSGTPGTEVLELKTKKILQKQHTDLKLKSASTY